MAQIDEQVKPKPVLGKAFGSACLGILSLALVPVGQLVPAPFAIVAQVSSLFVALVAVVVSLRARRELIASDGTLGGFGFSLTGLIAGGVVLATALLFTALPLVMAAVFVGLG